MRIVVLVTEDGFLMREYTRQIADALRDAFGEIEEFSYDGGSAALADVLDELRSYGLIQRHKLVILENADEFLKESKDDDDAGAPGSRPGHRQAMERYAADPVDHATLLMRARTWRAGKIDKAIAKVGMIFKAAALDDAAASAWVVKRCKKQYECEIKPDAAALLVAQVGAELGRLDVELGKVAAYVGTGGVIERSVVGELVGLSREEKVWAVQGAIASGEPRLAMAKFDEFRPIDSGTQTMIAWSIMDLMRKIHAAGRLLGQGENQFSVAKRLKLWGDAQNAIIGAARRMRPEVAADLLDRAVRTDQHNKSGVGNPVRSLEALAVEIADTIRKG